MTLFCFFGLAGFLLTLARPFSSVVTLIFSFVTDLTTFSLLLVIVLILLSLDELSCADDFPSFDLPSTNFVVVFLETTLLVGILSLFWSTSAFTPLSSTLALGFLTLPLSLAALLTALFFSGMILPILSARITRWLPRALMVAASIPLLIALNLLNGFSLVEVNQAIFA